MKTLSHSNAASHQRITNINILCLFFSLSSDIILYSTQCIYPIHTPAVLGQKDDDWVRFKGNNTWVKEEHLAVEWRTKAENVRNANKKCNTTWRLRSGRGVEGWQTEKTRELNPKASQHCRRTATATSAKVKLGLSSSTAHFNGVS